MTLLSEQPLRNDIVNKMAQSKNGDKPSGNSLRVEKNWFDAFWFSVFGFGEVKRRSLLGLLASMQPAGRTGVTERGV
jgi:hypothetical protein